MQTDNTTRPACASAADPELARTCCVSGAWCLPCYCCMLRTECSCTPGWHSQHISIPTSLRRCRGCCVQPIFGTPDRHSQHVFAHQPAMLQSLLERAVVLGFGSGQSSVSPALCDLIVQYAAILAAQVQPSFRAQFADQRADRQAKSTALSAVHKWAGQSCVFPVQCGVYEQSAGLAAADQPQSAAAGAAAGAAARPSASSCSILQQTTVNSCGCSPWPLSWLAISCRAAWWLHGRISPCCQGRRQRPPPICEILCANLLASSMKAVLLWRRAS